MSPHAVATPPPVEPPKPAPWYVELVDSSVLTTSGLAIAIDHGEPVIVDEPNRGITSIARLRPSPRGWQATTVADGASGDGFAIGPTGSAWSWESDTIRRGDIALEPVFNARVDHVVVDAHDVPFACQIAGTGKIEFVTPSRDPKAPWVVEATGLSGRHCRVAIAGDGNPVVAMHRDGGVIVASRTKGVWSQTTLSAGDGVAALATGPNGDVAIALVAKSEVRLARRVDGRWAHAVIGNAAGPVSSIALTVDDGGRAHVAFLQDYKQHAILAYIADGSPMEPIVADAITQVALAVEPGGEPHIVVSSEAGLFHFRHHGDPRDTIGVNELAVIDGCASLVATQLGLRTDDDPVRDRKHEADCARPHPGPHDLKRLCGAGEDISACLVIGFAAMPNSAFVTRLEVRAHACKEAGSTRCYTHVRVNGGRRPIIVATPDPKASATAFEAACALGSRVGCFALGLVDDDAVEVARGCGPDLPRACAVATVMLAGHPWTDGALVATIRTKLVTACASVDPAPEACNALAFIDDHGGANHRDTTSDHLRACVAGATYSCIVLLLRAKRPPPPSGFDGTQMTASLETDCESDEDACAALATALDTGWGVERDRARAAQIRRDAKARSRP